MQKHQLVGNSHYFSALVDVYGREGRAGFRVLDEMAACGVAPDRFVYTSLMRNCAAQQRYAAAWKLWENMRAYVEDPDEVTFTLMIAMCARQRESERALALYEEMLQLELHPTEATYDSLIRACAVRSDYASQAVLIFERMRAAGFVPSVVSFDGVLIALAHLADVSELERLHDIAKQMYPLVATLDARLIFSYGRHCERFGASRAEPMIARSNELIEKHRKEGTITDQLLDAHLSLLCGALRLSRANQFWSEAFASDKRRYAAHRVRHMMRMYSKAKRTKLALALANDALERNALDSASLSLAIGVCSKSAFLRSGVELWQRAAERGVRVRREARGCKHFLHLLQRVNRKDKARELYALATDEAEKLERDLSILPSRVTDIPQEQLLWRKVDKRVANQKNNLHKKLRKKQ